MTRRRPERRGDLAGLLGEARELTQPGGSDTRRLPLAELRPNAAQPRRHFDPGELEALTRSVREQGVLQPLLVRPLPGGGYEIAAGERRFRAAQTAGLPDVPVLIRELSDSQMLEVGLIENLQRENLNVLDEVEGTLRLVAGRLGLAPGEARGRMMVNLRRPAPEEVGVFEEVFALIGRETWQSFAKNKLRVLQWPHEVLQPLREGRLGYSAAVVVAAAPAGDREALLERALAGATRQELRALLAGRKPQAPAGRLDAQELRRLGRTLASARWWQGLSEGERAELDHWLRRMPARVRQALEETSE